MSLTEFIHRSLAVALCAWIVFGVYGLLVDAFALRNMRGEAPLEFIGYLSCAAALLSTLACGIAAAIKITYWVFA